MTIYKNVELEFKVGNLTVNKHTLVAVHNFTVECTVCGSQADGFLQEDGSIHVDCCDSGIDWVDSSDYVHKDFHDEEKDAQYEFGYEQGYEQGYDSSENKYEEWYDPDFVYENYVPVHQYEAMEGELEELREQLEELEELKEELEALKEELKEELEERE